jgi:hypothetical protein
MTEDPLLPWRSIKGFLHSLLFRFHFGDTPLQSDQIDNLNLTSLGFDVHPGPIKDAISDAQVLRKLLFVYVYCLDSPDCSANDSLFQIPGISQQIASKCIFYGTPSTSSDGYSAITGASFKSLPMCFLVQPRGPSLSKCALLGSLEGALDESSLTSLLGIGPPANPVESDPEETAAESETDVPATEEPDRERERIDREYESLAEVGTDDPAACGVNFHFPDNAERFKLFRKSDPASDLFVFARRFQYPKRFSMVSGFPSQAVPDGDSTIEALGFGTQFVVHVVDIP